MQKNDEKKLRMDIEEVPVEIARRGGADGGGRIRTDFAEFRQFEGGQYAQ